jgi:hypothetical protein
MSNNKTSNRKKRNETFYFWVAIGTAIGVGIGVAAGNIPIGVSVGIVLGITCGAALKKKTK